MDINAFNAAAAYGAAKKTIIAPQTKDAERLSDGATYSPSQAAKEMVNSVMRSETTAAAYMTGNADPHSVVEAMASAELAVETAVTLRNRVVEAYQELLRMPV